MLNATKNRGVYLKIHLILMKIMSTLLFNLKLLSWKQIYFTVMKTFVGHMWSADRGLGTTALQLLNSRAVPSWTLFFLLLFFFCVITFWESKNALIFFISNFFWKVSESYWFFGGGRQNEKIPNSFRIKRKEKQKNKLRKTVICKTSFWKNGFCFLVLL